jgi:hypothetical protein
MQLFLLFEKPSPRRHLSIYNVEHKYNEKENEMNEECKNWVIHTADVFETQTVVNAQTFHGTIEEMKKALFLLAAESSGPSAELTMEESNGIYRVQNVSNDYALVYSAYDPEKIQNLSRDILIRKLPEDAGPANREEDPYELD